MSFLFYNYPSSNIQDKDETTSDSLNDIDMSPEERFLPDSNSTSLETSDLNPARGDCSSTEQFINSQEDIVQNRLDAASKEFQYRDSKYFRVWIKRPSKFEYEAEDSRILSLGSKS